MPPADDTAERQQFWARRRLREAFEKLSPEDQAACRLDAIATGGYLIRCHADGTVERVPPETKGYSLYDRGNRPLRWWEK